MKKHKVTKWGEFSPRAYVSNGFIGFRFAKDPFNDVIGMMSGFSAMRKEPGVEALSILPAPNVSFTLGGDKCQVHIISQTYDFSCGELITDAILESNSEKIEVKYTVLCSRVSPTILLCSFEAQGDASRELRITVEYKVAENWLETVSEKLEYEPNPRHYDGKCQIFSSDRTSSAGVAYRFYGRIENKVFDDKMKTSLSLNTDGEPLWLVTSYVPSVMHSEPHNQAQRMLRLTQWQGIERCREMNTEAWAKLWQSRIVIDGAGEEWQDVIDASFFYLMSSVSEFAPMSVSPFGLSEPDAYEGHCFWDTESFMFMPPLFCAPQVARSMLDYRYKRIGAAADNARLNGYLGIQFPWQSLTTGCEVTEAVANQAGEHHVNLDIALAFDAYARVHADEGYIKEFVWPVIRGVCEWIESRVIKTRRGYEILHITGIEEGDDNVDNDSFSNIMSARLLRSGSDYSVFLGLGVRKKWLEIADKMYVPVRKDGVLCQYENMPEKDVQPSTTLMAYFPYGYSDPNGAENDLRTMEYYVTHGMKEYCRYPMLSGFLGVFPAWLGDSDEALATYERANLTFFVKPFFSSAEWSVADPAERENPTRHIPTNFITGRGSLLSGLIMGLTKMCPWKGRFDGPIDEWFDEGIVLPTGWKKITIGRVYIRGAAYRIEAEHGADRARIIKLDDNEI